MELDYMKDTDKQKKFIELRAKNYSFQRISDKIGVSKPTLFKWDKEFSHEIDTLNSIELESLYQEYMTTTKQRVEYLGKLHQKLIKELQNRELKEIKTDKLLEMIIKTNNELEQIKSNNKLRFLTKDDVDKCKSHERFMESLSLLP